MRLVSPRGVHNGAKGLGSQGRARANVGHWEDSAQGVYSGRGEGGGGETWGEGEGRGEGVRRREGLQGGREALCSTPPLGRAPGAPRPYACRCCSR